MSPKQLKRMAWLTTEWKSQTRVSLQKIGDRTLSRAIITASEFHIPYSTFSARGYAYFIKKSGTLWIKGKDLKKLMKLFLEMPCKESRPPVKHPVAKLAETVGLPDEGPQNGPQAPQKDVSVLLRAFNRLTVVLDTFPRDDARELAFRLAERYSRSAQGSLSEQEKNMAAEVEKPQT